MDVIVIGAYGSAGVVVAERLAEAPDVELTLFDDGDPGGGLCILRGCMPSKELLSAGEHRFLARHDDRLAEPPSVDVERTVERKDDHTANWATHRRKAVHKLADRDDVEFVRESARFVDEGTVAAGGETYSADYVVVATGSVPNVPDLDGLDDVPFHTSAEVLDATEFPDSAVVMGFGYVGLELVPYLSEVGGVDLTVIEHDDRPLDEADPAFGDALLDYYREQFDVDVVTNARERRVEPTDEGVRMHLDTGEAVDAEALYLFTGRRPNVDGLDLEAAGIETGEGWVRDTMQARDDDRVFVVGDANGREPILHVAKEQGGVAADNVLAHDADEELDAYENVHHHVVFSGLGALPYARVGHSKAAAESADEAFVHVSREAADDGVFKTKAVPEGRASLVVGTDGTVLGWQGLHYHADVMAKTMQIAVEMGLDVREIPDRAYHPTTPEILDGLVREAASEVHSTEPTD
ncbi:dihydrolipoyl dehydrogenase family protein [Halorarius halobius]|uniref:dihydrolipoyl dehydrogenase family protein n=1 Tax=Halorarius halobius TaxID=2962671 RepID=UPI0020CBD9D9|nr:NAD(P)/FAD-dependent oxidoreductase [Halorarius halobius]